MTATRFLRTLTLALVAGMAGCVVSPQPSPPEMSLDGSGIGLTATAELVGGVVGFAGGPGTVSPAKGKVLVTNLDAKDAPSFADVQPDGSFTVAVPGQPGQVFRFQAKSGDTRSEPYDLDLSSAGGDLAAAVDAPGCLSLTPGRWLALTGSGDERQIVLHNGCAAAITTTSPHLRRGLAGFTVFPAAPIAIPAGGSLTLTARADDGAEVEDVVLFDVTGPEPSRRAITLTVPDR